MIGLAVVVIVVAYLFGSIPMGVMIARAWGVNLLDSGSGHTGGTNVLRSVGLLPAGLTILGDALKGLIPTYIAMGLFQISMQNQTYAWVAAVAGAAAVIGHNHSVFLKFRGGVGAVTALAALAVLSFPAALTAAIIAIVAIVISRYASMASFSGSVTGLVMLIGLSFFRVNPPAFIIYGVIVVGIVSWALRENFVRIKAGTERKIGVEEKVIKTIS